MTSIRQNLIMIIATMVMFSAALLINELLFKRLEFAEGINWIYLPAGVRLLATLLFAEAGAIGLLAISPTIWSSEATSRPRKDTTPTSRRPGPRTGTI